MLACAVASAAAVPQAHVVARGGPPSARTTRTGADGRSSLALRGGAYRLEVTRIGYRNARPRTLNVDKENLCHSEGARPLLG